MYSKRFVILLIAVFLLILSGFYIFSTSPTGGFYLSPYIKSGVLNVGLLSGSIMIFLLFLGYRKKERDVKEIEEYMSQRHGKMKRLRVKYSDEIDRPSGSYNSMTFKELLRATYFSVRHLLDAANSTITPYVEITTREGLRKRISSLYKQLDYTYKDPDLDFREKKAESKAIIRCIDGLSYAYGNFDIWSYMVKGHEIAHHLAQKYKIDDIAENEGLAEAYGFKLAMLKAAEGRLPLTRTVDMIRHEIEYIKGLPRLEQHRKGFDTVLGSDFYVPRKVGEAELEDLIKQLDEKISLTLSKKR